MGTTMDDVRYEEYLEDLHKSYIKALERFATSKNISELQKHLEELQDAKSNLPDWMSDAESEGLDDLKKVISEMDSIEQIYELLISEGKKNKNYFLVGVVLALVGILLSVASLFF